MNKDEIKSRVGAAAAQLIRDGMMVGLGSGTTSTWFVHHLGKRCKEGLQIKAIASSNEISELAANLGIPLLPMDQISKLDITVDGADQVDPHKQMIKGLGGALVREKILASMSKEMVVIIDESKLVGQLGKILPVEVIPFGYKATLNHIEKLGYKGQWRKNPDHSFFISDNGNFNFDIHFKDGRDNPRKDHETLIQIPGIVDTGFFFDLAGRLIIGFNDGQVITRT